MNTDIVGPIDTKVYTSANGRAVIEQSSGRSVVLSAEQILAVINRLHICYDYCAAWKEGTDDKASNMEPQL